MRHSLETLAELPGVAYLLAVEAAQLVEDIGRAAASAAAERQDKPQDQPDDAQAAPAQRDRTTAHAAPPVPNLQPDPVPDPRSKQCPASSFIG